MKKMFLIFVFVLSVFTFGFKVDAETTDTIGPVIEKIELDKEEVSPGDILRITLTVTDESEIDTVRIIYNKGYNGTDDLGKSFYATKQDDGTYVGEIEITDKFYSDYYRISTGADDIHGNSASITQDIVFKVVGAIEDAKGPVIEKIDLDKEEVSPGDILKVTLTVTDESEIDTVRIIYNKGYNGTDDIGKSFYATKQDDGTYVGEIEITDKFYSDYYRITTSARDIYGNNASQTQDAVFKVVGAIEDVVGPAIEKIELDKEIVSAGDTLKIILTVTDDSEIDNVRIVYVKGEYINSSGSKSFYATKQEDGTYVGKIEITDAFEIGKYKISTTARDIYGNKESLVQETNFYVEEKNNDVTGPEIEKMELSSNEVNIGDTLRVTVTAIDESEIDQVVIYYVGNNIEETIYATKQADGTYVAEIEITEKFQREYYTITAYGYDIHGYSSEITKDDQFYVKDGIKDIVGPVIEKIEVDKEVVSPGDIIRVTLTVTDDSEIDYVYIYCAREKNSNGNGISKRIEKQEDGTYVGEIEITEEFYSDGYRISTGAYDIHGNSASISRDGTFSVVGGIEDITAPKIEKIEITPAEVSPGDIVTIKITVTDESDIDKVYFYYYKGLYEGGTSKAYETIKQEDGTYVGQIEITDKFFSDYYRVSVTAYDAYGNSKYSDQSSIFLVTGGIDDLIKPEIDELQVDKEIVRPGDIVTIKVKATDESGIGKVEISYTNPLRRGTPIKNVREENGYYIAELEITEEFYSGYYSISVTAYDIYENRYGIAMDNMFKIIDGLNDITSIILSENEITLNKGESNRLEYTINPNDTTQDKTLTWKSSDESVVTVENGLIKAVGRGTATITVTTTNGKKATAKVTVKEPKVLSVTVEKTEYNLTIDSEDITINPTIETQDNPTYEIEWTSSNENVVTIEEGVLKVIGTGAATITLKAQDKLATIEVNVTSPLKEITINESINEMLIGETIQLTIQYNPVNTTDNKKIIWTSSDESIAIVENGLVTALEKGTVTITAMSLYGMTSSITITINSLYDGEYTSQKYNLDNPFIYTHTENFNLDDINVTGDYTKEYKDNILYIKAKGQVVAEYYVITIASDEYEITDNEIKYKGEFDLSKINFLINESVKITTYDELPQQKGFYLILELNENILEISHWVYVNDEEGGGSSLKQLSLRKIKEITDIIMTNSIDEMLFGEQYQLTAKINPADTDEEKILTWTSSDEKVITVENGLIKAVGRGTATITVTTVNGKTATAIVTVKEPKVLSVTVEKTEYNLTIDSEDITINPIIETQDNPTYEIEWTSSNENVVTIEKGLLKVIGPGAAIITITAGNESVTIQVFVEQKDIANLNYSEVESQIYNGTEIKPTIIITDGEYQLKENIDYTIEYNNNLNAGTAEITITGINNYKGNNKINFVIEKAKLEINYISENTEYTYDGLLHGINLNIISPNNVVIKYADEYGEYTLDTMPMYKEIGEYKILYKLMIDSNYEFITGENTLIIKKATIDVTSKDYIGIEDEEEHTIDLKVNNTEEYDIYYSVDSTDYNLNEMPKFKLPGVYEIFFKIISNNFEEYTSSNIIKIFGITEYAESLKLKNDILIIKDYDNSILNLYNKIKFYASTYKWKHFDNNKEIVDRETLKTGDYVQLILNDEKIYEYNISILGDVDGDGEIAPLDYVKIKNHIMATNLIKEGVSLIAADANGDEIVSPLDYVRVKNYIMNGGK